MTDEKDSGAGLIGQPIPDVAETEPRLTSCELHQHRSIQLLRATVSMLCHFVWFRRTRPGDHMWTIPVDKDRDFDCILSDGITELEMLRRRVDQLIVENGVQQDLREMAAEFVRRWTTDRTPDGCGMCGGIPHSVTCDVGRMAAVLGSGNQASPEQADAARRSGAPKTACLWYPDEDGNWHASCGLTWVLTGEGTPLDHQMHYCPKCGQALRVVNR